MTRTSNGQKVPGSTRSGTRQLRDRRASDLQLLRGAFGVDHAEEGAERVLVVGDVEDVHD